MQPYLRRVKFLLQPKEITRKEGLDQHYGGNEIRSSGQNSLPAKIGDKFRTSVLKFPSIVVGNTDNPASESPPSNKSFCKIAKRTECNAAT